MATNDRDEILSGLEPLFAKAKAEGLWFHCGYQDLWFSPKRLREQHKRGNFIWGAVNWRLVDPKERLRGLRRIAESARRHADEFEQELNKDMGL